MGTIRDQNDELSQENVDERSASELDDLDIAILRHLERHGRATNYEVGEAVGLSASAASRRIQALEKLGAIRGYRALVDDRLLGKRMTVYIRVTLERQSAERAGRVRSRHSPLPRDRQLPSHGRPIRLHAGGPRRRHRRLWPPPSERVIAPARRYPAGNQLCPERRARSD